MTHSVPPPEPLPIVQILPPEAIRSASIIASVPVADTQSLTTPTPSPTLAESSAPETSPFSAAKSAAVLGPPISVGYPIKSAETPNSSSSVAEAVAAPFSSATELNNPGQSPSEAIATPQALSVSPQKVAKQLPTQENHNLYRLFNRLPLLKSINCWQAKNHCQYKRGR